MLPLTNVLEIQSGEFLCLPELGSAQTRPLAVLFQSPLAQVILVLQAKLNQLYVFKMLSLTYVVGFQPAEF